MSDEAMKLALEALKESLRDLKYSIEHDTDIMALSAYEGFEKTIKAIEEALAKQEQDEPVGYIDYADSQVVWKTKKPANGSLLYTTPQQRKPLTDDEFTTAIEVEGIPVEDVELVWAIKDLVEAAHGIKEAA